MVVYRIGGEIRLCCRLIERERGRGGREGGERERRGGGGRMYHTVLYDFRVIGVI